MRPRSASVPPRGTALPDAQPIPFDALVGEAEANRLDKKWGTLCGPIIKRGRPCVHAWEAKLNPDLVAIPRNKNPQLDRLIDLEGVRKCTPVLWCIGAGETLLLGPQTQLSGVKPGTNKTRRLGHPSLLPGTLKNTETGEWWGKQARISGELGWDAKKQSFYIINQSGRYCLNRLDRGRSQMESAAQRFAEVGLPVEIRILEE